MAPLSLETEKAKLEYPDLGAWARHYDTVRMAVAAFFVTLAVALIQVQRSAEASKVALSVLLFVFGSAVYLYLSHLTFKRINDQLTRLRSLGASTVDVSRREYSIWSEPSGLPGVLICGVIFAGSILCWTYPDEAHRWLTFWRMPDQPVKSDRTIDTAKLAEPTIDLPKRAENVRSNPTEATRPFPDFGFLPPRELYNGPLFRLSQDYPSSNVGFKRPDFLNIPFNENENEQNWLKYLLAVRNYCFEGNVEVDWEVRRNPVQKWYHAPWQHWGRGGREGIRGLTREATAKRQQLAPTQKDNFQTYAVAFYNDIGGYTMGQVWRDRLNPDVSDIRFDVGTVVFKLLFTQATIDQVPYLDPPVEWNAYVEASDADRARSVQKLRLLQMDIMVRDDRVMRINGTGWVFGTYCYNGKLGNTRPFENLIPVGIQWGNDEDVTDDHNNPKPTKTIINPKLRETIINPSSDLPPQHLGWNGRLNGPADYYGSSCMSCHSTAQYPVQRHQNPEFGKRKIERGSSEWMIWFRNFKCGEAFSEHSNSTDFSLQLSIGIHNFHQWRNKQGGFDARRAELPIEILRGID